MVVATVLFSRLMGDVHDMLQLSTREEVAVAESLEGVIAFLRANHVPVALQERIRAWAAFRLSRERADAQLQSVLAILPEGLRQGVAASANRALFGRVRLLQHVHDPLDRAQFAAALLSRMRMQCFPRDAVVADHRAPADRLMVVLEGRVSMVLPRGRFDLQGSECSLSVLHRGDSIGDGAVRTAEGLCKPRTCGHVGALWDRDRSRTADGFVAR